VQHCILYFDVASLQKVPIS